jgi:regulator of RNase E activity RraA
VTDSDIVFVDADGVIFAPAEQAEEILSIANKIWKKE